jgi:hypothetical protein
MAWCSQQWLAELETVGLDSRLWEPAHRAVRHSAMPEITQNIPDIRKHTVKSRKSQAYEPLLLENEREAVADLLQYLESSSTWLSVAG